MHLWAGRGTGAGAFQEPLPRLSFSPCPSSPPQPPTTTAKLHTDEFRVPFTVIKEKGLHIRPFRTSPNPVCQFADAEAWFSSLHIRGVGQEAKSLCLCVCRVVVVCSATWLSCAHHQRN